MVRILIVDDHEVVREGLLAALSRNPEFSIVAVASDGREALEEAQKTRPDVALVDLRLPDMSGSQLCARLRERLPDLVVLMLSTYMNEKAVRDSLSAGASAYVAKAAGLPELRLAIKRAIGDVESSVSTSPQIVEQLRRVVDRRMQDGSPSPRQCEVLELASQGLTDTEIGARLFITRSTVRFHLDKLKRNLAARSKTELISKAIRFGLVTNGLSDEVEVD